MASDKRFVKLNLLTIARVFLDMDVESDYFKGIKNARLEKLKLLATLGEFVAKNDNTVN